MIKIKKISPERFYENLKNNACDCHHELKIFGKNNFVYHEQGFYYHCQKNRIVIYYETGERNKFGGITEIKSFLFCWNKKIFGKDFMISVLADSIEYWPFFGLIMMYGLFFGDTIQSLIIEIVSIIGLFFFLNFHQKLNLLNFIDEICDI